MLQRLVWSVLLVPLAGCPYPAHPVSTPEIYLTGFVQRNAAGQDTLVDLTLTHPSGESVAANSPLSFEHEAKLHIRDVQGSQIHDYDVLVGPDFETGTGMDFQVRTSAATLNIIIGWALLIGQWPLAETDLVSTSPSGTFMAVRVQRSPRQDYVYNLEPATSLSIVNVVTASQTVSLSPGTYVVVTPSAVGTAQPTPTDDPFVAYALARAAVARFDTTR